MNAFLKYKHVIIVGLLPFLCIMLLKTAALAGRDSDGREISTTSVKWVVKNDLIIIKYNLKTDPNMKIKVDILMKNERDTSFTAELVTAEGAIGEGYYNGNSHEVRWLYRRDYPNGFVGEGYFFEVRVQETEKENHWIYYALGAAAIAGSVVALIITNGQEASASSTAR